jgi:hypothetical protein
MAKSDPKPKCTGATITIPEVQHLADRLLARGQAGSGAPDQPGEGDLRLAAKALHAMTRSFNRYDVLHLDC